MTRTDPQPPTSRAFTLIELLVVIGVISILLTLSISVGLAVTRSGEDRLTRDHIRVLDTTLTAWYGEKDSKFPGYLIGDAIASPLGTVERSYPIIDGREVMSPAGSTEPTLAAFLLIAGDTASMDQTLKQQIDVKYLRPAPLLWTLGGGPATYNGQVSALTIVDGWNQPIRFVHPLWHGGYGNTLSGAAIGRPTREVSPKGQLGPYNYSRSYQPSGGGIGDADEGLCPSNRPYFYSAGRDGDPGTRDDNIYSTVPSFPPETAPVN